MSSTPADKKEHRPSVSNRHPTAPSVMLINGHSASAGETSVKEQYDHGIQVIDEDKEFK